MTNFYTESTEGQSAQSFFYNCKERKDGSSHSLFRVAFILSRIHFSLYSLRSLWLKNSLCVLCV